MDIVTKAFVSYCLTFQVAKHLKEAKPAEVAKHLGDLTYSLVNDPNKVNLQDLPQLERIPQLTCMEGRQHISVCLKTSPGSWSRQRNVKPNYSIQAIKVYILLNNFRWNSIQRSFLSRSIIIAVL